MNPNLINNLDELIPLVAVGGGLVFGLCWLFVHYAHETSKAKQREQSRREIAAYIAEGSMTPEQGERLMAAGEKPEAKEARS